jgi:hypothetical protein
MSAMTPMRYAERYLHLEVPFADGPVTVSVDRYVTQTPTAEKDQLWNALVRALQKTPKLSLTVNGEAVQFTSVSQLQFHVLDPFFGKGSPEDCQIVLQLAVMLGRVPSKQALQAYADANLGLDCNGFVGNYLFHVLGGNGWRTDARESTSGPKATITQIMHNAGGFAIHSVDDMTPSRMYVLAEVDAQGMIIAGGPTTTPGHIVITEPGRYQPSFMTMDLSKGASSAIGAPAYWGTESTGHVGLTQSWYAVMPLTRGGKPVADVFRVYRSSKHSFLNFRIIGLG